MQDIDTFRSADFGGFLLESKLVGPGKEKFLVHWVRKFSDFRLNNRNIGWHEQVPLFLKELRKSDSYQDWQIRQADQAVRLYFSNFLKAKTPPDDPRNPPVTAATEQAALQMFQENLRLRGYARRTEQTYAEWVTRYFAYRRSRSNASGQDSGVDSNLVRDFLAHLAVRRNVSAATQNLAFNSLLMFFRLVYNKDLGDLKEAVRARARKRLPVVFSFEETAKLLQQTEGTVGLMLKIIYGGGLRVNECCRLRIKDIDFDQQLIFVRDSKGGKDRTTVLPKSLNGQIKAHIARVFTLHDQDLAEGFGSVWLPDALARKYPGASAEKAWQYLFPSSVRSIDPESNIVRRHHVSDSTLQRAVKMALNKAGIHKHACPYAAALLCHSSAAERGGFTPDPGTSRPHES